MLHERNWDSEPKAGWHEFQAARRRQADLMWAESQLHDAVRSVRADAFEARSISPTCQLRDETD